MPRPEVATPVAAVQQLTGGRGIDVIIDGVGGAVTQQSFETSTYRGRVMMYCDAGRDPRDCDLSVIRGNDSIIDVSPPPEFATPRVIENVQRHLADVAAQKLRVVVAERFPLSEPAHARRLIESRQAVGRMLLILDA